MRAANRLAVVVLLAGAACRSSLVESDVSGFRSDTKIPQQASFHLLVPGEHMHDLEYRSYADELAFQLQNKKGWKPASLENADFIVVFECGIDKGRDKHYASTVPTYGQIAGGTTYSRGTVTSYGSGGYSIGTYAGRSYSPPVYGVTGSRTKIRTKTIYTRALVVHVVDASKLRREEVEVAWTER